MQKHNPIINKEPKVSIILVKKKAKEFKQGRKFKKKGEIDE